MGSGFHSEGHRARAGSTSRDRGPRLALGRGVAGRIDSCKCPRVVECGLISRVKHLLSTNTTKRHTLIKEKQSGLPDAGLETGAEPIHTCLNRTSHLERSHSLPAVVASPSLGWRPLLLPTTLSTRSAEHHWSRPARPGRRPGRSPAPRKQPSRCEQAGRQRLPGTCSARRTHHHSPTLALAVAQALACA